MKIPRIDLELSSYLIDYARAWGITFDEALRRNRAADNFIVVNGLARFVRSTQPDGRIQG